MTVKEFIDTLYPTNSTPIINIIEDYWLDDVVDKADDGCDTYEIEKFVECYLSMNTKAMNFKPFVYMAEWIVKSEVTNFAFSGRGETLWVFIKPQGGESLS